MQRVLVAGATGNLGKRVVRELTERGYWVRALGRSPERLAAVNEWADDLFIADATRAESLSGVCDGIDVVFSSLGQTLSLRRQRERSSFHRIDYRGNRNLLEVARNGLVKKFIYVSVFGADRLKGLEYVQAHEEVVRELQPPGLDYTVIRPTAFFSTFGEALRMAASGRAIVVGDGERKINPIHEADLAKVCVDAVESSEREVAAGGPRVYTRQEIALLGFAALERKGAIIRLPAGLANLLARCLRPFDQRMSALMAFGTAAMQIDCVAPAAGTRTLDAFFSEMATTLRRLG